MFIEKLELNNDVKNYLLNLFKDNLILNKEDAHLVDNVKIEKINENIRMRVNGFTGRYGTTFINLDVVLSDFGIDISSIGIQFNAEGFKKGYFKFMAENFKSDNKEEDYFNNFLKMLKLTVETCFNKNVKLEVMDKKEVIKNKFEEMGK